ncbi:hypothetical protein EDB87DRAFT_1598731 [Lactarius vividus]|nr:hypothetical protein EDB87DRAFT_1598731 [Lactarius vividus]
MVRGSLDVLVCMAMLTERRLVGGEHVHRDRIGVRRWSGTTIAIVSTGVNDNLFSREEALQMWIRLSGYYYQSSGEQIRPPGAPRHCLDGAVLRHLASCRHVPCVPQGERCHGRPRLTHHEALILVHCAVDLPFVTHKTCGPHLAHAYRANCLRGRLQTRARTGATRAMTLIQSVFGHNHTRRREAASHTCTHAACCGSRFYVQSTRRKHQHTRIRTRLGRGSVRSAACQSPGSKHRVRRRRQ